MHLTWWLLVVVGSPWVGGALLALFGRRWGRLSGVLAFVAAAVSALAVAVGSDPGGGPDLVLRWQWIPSMEIDFALRLDALSFPFLVNVLGVSLIAICYGWGYLHDGTGRVRPRPLRPESARPEGRLHLFYALLLGFMGAMLGTLLSDDVFLFFVFWESMLVTSSLLLVGWGESDRPGLRERVGQVTLKYFIFTQVGSLLILMVLVVLVGTTGSSSLAVIATRLSNFSRTQLTWLSFLLIVGFCVKLAIFPLHTWLPDAHSIAPMPVTVMLAAAMLSMGAYGILRFPMATLRGVGMGPLQLPLMIVALVSEIYGALMCLASRDIKRLVAYSSVSQMGYVLFALGSLTPRGVAGGTFHVISHGILKALLFMGVGLIMRGTGRRQIDELGGLSRRMPWVTMGLGIGAIAISGMPPFCAFHSEWMIFSAGISSPYPVLAYFELLAPLFTAAYALWFVVRLAFNPVPPGLRVSRNPRAMRWSFCFLVILALLVGLYPAPVYRWVERAAALVLPTADRVGLTHRTGTSATASDW